MRCLGTSDTARVRSRLRAQWKEFFPLCEHPECRCMRTHCGVLVDGRVVPCCLDADGVLTLGNLFNEPLDAILTSPRATAIREGFSCRRAVEPLCRTCGFVERFRRKSK